MNVVPGPTRIELARVRTPAGETQFVLRMTTLTGDLVGTPTFAELVALRRMIGKALRANRADIHAFPAPPPPTIAEMLAGAGIIPPPPDPA